MRTLCHWTTGYWLQLRFHGSFLSATLHAACMKPSAPGQYIYISLYISTFTVSLLGRPVHGLFWDEYSFKIHYLSLTVCLISSLYWLIVVWLLNKIITWKTPLSLTARTPCSQMNIYKHVNVIGDDTRQSAKLMNILMKSYNVIFWRLQIRARHGVYWSRDFCDMIQRS